MFGLARAGEMSIQLRQSDLRINTLSTLGGVFKRAVAEVERVVVAVVDVRTMLKEGEGARFGSSALFTSLQEVRFPGIADERRKQQLRRFTQHVF